MIQELFRLEHISFKHQNGIKITDLNCSILQGSLHCLFCPSNRTRTALYEFLTGEITDYTGSIHLDGEPISAKQLKANSEPHLAFLREDTELFPELSVAENILGGQKSIFVRGRLDEQKLYSWATLLLEQYKADKISANTRFKKLTLIDRKIIAVLRAIGNDAHIIFIEDSLANYNATDIKKYLAFLTRVVSAGIPVVLVTDRFNDFVLFSDHISIIRNGTVIYHTETTKLSRKELATLTRSGTIVSTASKAEIQNGEPLFEISDRANSFYPIDLYPSEILGIYDPDWLVGARIQNVIAEMVANKRIRARDFGIITEEDTTSGIFRNLSLYENISLNSNIVFDGVFGTYNKRMDYYTVNHILRELDEEALINKYSALEHLPKMSNSEQMAIVVARYLCADTKAFIFINPYLGYNDDTVKRFHSILLKLRGLGHPSIIISKSDTQMKQLCDRIVVPQNGDSAPSRAI